MFIVGGKEGQEAALVWKVLWFANGVECPLLPSELSKPFCDLPCSPSSIALLPSLLIPFLVLTLLLLGSLESSEL